jgi:predicted amidohydrolase YtcJ
MMIFLANQVESTIDKIKTFFDYLYQKGVYYAEDMLLTNEKFYSLIQSTAYARRTSFWADMETFKSLSADTQKGVTGIKLFTDGAVGARTAALSEPFKSGEKGYLLFPDEEMYRLMREVSILGKAASVHAIGDLAVKQAVRTARRLKEEGLWFPLLRLEHCQFIPESAAREAKEMGIVISMQPNFSIDSTIYTDRLSQRYLEWNNPFRMLIDTVGFIPGEDLILGSDGMPQGVEGAVSSALFPPFPHQRLTLDEFTAAYCMPDTQHGEIQVEIDETAILAVNPPADLMPAHFKAK